MATQIATACGRSDLFAFYVSGEGTSRLPVIGWDEDGRPLVATRTGAAIHAGRARVFISGVRCPFSHVSAEPVRVAEPWA